MLELTHTDGTPITSEAFEIERGIDSVVLEVKIKNLGVFPVSNAIVSMFAERISGSGLFYTSGHPVLDERMGRFQITGMDSSGTPGQEVGSSAVQPLGVDAVAQLPSILPGNFLLANIWLAQGTISANEEAVNVQFRIPSPTLAIPLPNGVSEVGTGILRDATYPFSFLIQGREVTESAIPDSTANIAAGSWQYLGTEYSRGIDTLIFNQDDGASEALEVGESYIAAIVQLSGAPSVILGLRSATPVRPDVAGNPVLAWVTVNYDATATVISTDDIENTDNYGRFLVVPPATGLSGTKVHAGRAISSGFMQTNPDSVTIALDDLQVNRVWLEPNGAKTVGTSGVPPSPGSLLLATIETDATDVISFIDERIFIPNGSRPSPRILITGVVFSLAAGHIFGVVFTAPAAEAADIDINLPPASLVPAGSRILFIHNTDSANTTTINAYVADGDVIDDSGAEVGSYDLVNGNDYLDLCCDGVREWIVVGRI